MSDNFNTLILCKYNSYYNRTIKIEKSINDYITYRTTAKNIPNYNFNPNDGINAELVINNNDEAITQADYVIVADNTGTKIISRWFILECVRTRGGQYRLNVYRDTIADNFNSLLDAPVFVEKSSKINVNDNFIFNSENMTFNQIKQSEDLLKDETNCAWIVGYIPRDFKNEANKPIEIDYLLTNSADIIVTNLSNWGYYNQINEVRTGSLKSGTVGIYIYAVNQPNMITDGFKLDGTHVNLDNSLISQPVGNIPSPSKTDTGLVFTTEFDEGMIYDLRNRLTRNMVGNVLEDFKQAIRGEEGIMSDGNFTAIKRLQGQIIHETSTNTYYKVNVEFNTSTNIINCTGSESQILSDNLNFNAVTNNPIIDEADPDDNPNYKLEYICNTYTITIEQYFEKASIDLTGDRYHLTDQPYDMFCMPYSDDLAIYKNGTLQFKSNKNLALAVGTSIATAIGSTGVYDVQLLPYCPVRYCIQDRDEIEFDFGDAFVSPIKKDTTIIGYLYWANSSNFTFNIEKSIKIRPDAIIKDTYNETIDNLGFVSITNPFLLSNITSYEVIDSTIPVQSVNYNETTQKFAIFFGLDNKNKSVRFTFQYSMERTLTNENLKVNNECDTYRLVSPNYNGQFEFSLAKNGDINYFNIDCTYKPFNPYIHVNPNFGRLYGKDFNDARGLICSGDFSLPQITSAWANYEANNKNYKSIFDRQIQNMELKNSIYKTQEIVGSIASATSTGVEMGMMTGNPLVGIGTGIASGIGGAIDFSLNNRLRNEALDYAKDMYSYNLGNIKAIPYSLSGIGALNFNNKLFPFIEYYSCSKEEKEALKSKLRYDGASIGRIGTIREFLGYNLFEDTYNYWYIKGRIIRLEIGGDNQQLLTIASELLKGIYISTKIGG